MACRRDTSAINPLVKYFLFFENFLIWVVGLTVTILGAYILVQKKKVVRDVFDFLLDPSTIMCTAGSIAVFVSFFGCLGALRENTCFLRFYNYVVTFLFIGEIALVIFVFIFYFVPDAREKLGLFPEKAMQEAIEKYGVVDDDDMVNLIDDIQRSLKCCGLGNKEDGYLDWNQNMYFNCTTASKSPKKCSVPASCCKIKEGDTRNIMCGRNVMQPLGSLVTAGENVGKIYTDGCLKALGDWINANALVAGGVLLAILVPQMFVMSLSRSLWYQIMKQKSKRNNPRRFQDDGNAPIPHGVNNPAFDRSGL